MDKAFIDILQKLITEQGREALLNPSKCKAFLADYTRGEYKKESRLLLQALEAGAANALDAAEDIALCKQQQVKVLREEYFLAEEVAADVVDTLVLVLRGEEKKNRCKNCGKELPVEWKACPYCGTVVTSQKVDSELPSITLTEAPKTEVPAIPLTEPQSVATPVQATPTPPSSLIPPAPQPAPQKKHTVRNVLIAVAGVVLLSLVIMYFSAPTPASMFEVRTINNNSIEITRYTGSSKNVIIPSHIQGLPVTSIGVAAFSHKQLSSVLIPNSVIIIESSAFINNQLSSVLIPDSVTTIGFHAFWNNLLNSVTVPRRADVRGAFDPSVTITRRTN